MLNVVLVTPIYAESGSETGVFTQTLASFLIQSDHRVTVVCSHAASARPSHAETGRLSIHRLAAKGPNRQRSFATLALSRVHELAQSDRCDTIISIDADPFSILAASTLRHEHTLLDLQTEHINPELPLPLTMDAWQPPCFNGHVLLGIADTDALRDRLIDAYRLSQAHTLGWSLALPDPNGDWRIVCSSESPQSGNEAILVSMRPGRSVLQEIATAHGVATIPYDTHLGDIPRMVKSMNTALEIDADQRRTAALEHWKRERAVSTIEARRILWDQYVTDASSRGIGDHLGSWLRLERTEIAACAAGGAA